MKRAKPAKKNLFGLGGKHTSSRQTLPASARSYSYLSSKLSTVSTRRVTPRTLTYRGVKISPSGEGWQTSLDASVFDSPTDAKRFITAWKKRGGNPARLKRRNDVIDDAAAVALATTGAVYEGLSVPYQLTVQAAKTALEAKEALKKALKFNAEKSRGRAMKTNKRKGNPPAAAERLYDKFHGRPATETTVVEEEVHEHEHLTILGPLVEVFIETPTGLLAHINFDDEDLPFLCSSEDGTQLYVEKGDQSIDLASLQMETEDWLKDRMILGRFAAPHGKRTWNIVYRTKKRFDDFKEIDYQHDLGEETGDRPALEYEPRSQKLFIAGGRYRIDLPLIGMSPGIEN